MIFNFKKNKDKSVEISNIDDITDLIADKVNAKNDEVMSLTQENERLQREYDAKAYTVKQLENKLARKNEDFEILDRVQKETFEDLDSKVLENRRLENELFRIKNNYDELSKKKISKESKAQITKLKQVNDNQLKFIEILQVIASAKSDKTQLKDVFSHNLDIYLKNNFKTHAEASKFFGIHDSTLRDLRKGRTALTFDNLDILDSKLCEYFECSVYGLVTVKLNKEDSQ